MSNPFFTYAGVLERSTHLIHAYLHDDPNIVGYQFWGQTTPDDAYGNPAASGVGGAGAVPMFQVATGVSFRSPRIRRGGRDFIEESRRGTTHAIWDMDDFIGPGVGLPPDEGWLFLRVQENRRGVGLLTVPGPLPVLGPIYVVPPVSAYGMAYPTLTLQGVAPSGVVGVAAGAPAPFSEDLTSAAPRPLVLTFPVPIKEISISNQHGANALLVSFGPYQILRTIPAGTSLNLFSGGAKSVVLAAPAAGGCPYSLHAVLNRG